jgi:hypothetical protein
MMGIEQKIAENWILTGHDFEDLGSDDTETPLRRALQILAASQSHSAHLSCKYINTIDS